ncbi:hypothetical protein [Hymenobacter convexus]|uniref:hypothetical protein n=1 Tax=Hymenobacter sp. CA1UV-4 TaxID=3063782 RepID=UPI002713E62A|nr:hypothetical protein [Hymenobacter sp. CA1UV-4]MDO7850773.1 hypothetical protein [Hymenobacter sp. CA1UV-4]
MIHLNRAFWAACVLALGGCQSATAPDATANAKQLMHNDFEASVGWGGIAEGSLTDKKAHGGHWSVQAGPDATYGFTFERVLGRLADPVPHKLRLQGWALRANPGSTARLVVQVNASPTDTAKVFYGSLPMAEAVREFDKWTAVSYSFSLPAKAAAGNDIKIYLWRDQATAPTYLDDVELLREE